MTEFFIPLDVSPLFAGILVFSSFFTSALTAALGLGGGVAMLAIMGIGLPVNTLLPVHGIVQLGSNFGRSVIQRRYLIWPLIGYFMLGSIIGVILGGKISMMIPEFVAKILLGSFILWSVYGARPRPTGTSRTLLTIGGAITSVATMIVGATGPLVAALLSSRGLTKQPLIATHAACLVAQHGLKILAFGFMGFAYAQWAPLLAAMIASGVLGTWLGSVFLDNLPERFFRLAFKITMTLLGVQIIWTALSGAAEILPLLK
ncbi:sulfite exporter TauE/SafE family protein [Rhizobium puerariae]|uniref:Probable membrane transporter protein n=1 Tax=Rhizobium puerariae TaxID=1585791 RepID=A0ABV6AJG5_9HYPH